MTELANLSLSLSLSSATRNIIPALSELCKILLSSARVYPPRHRLQYPRSVPRLLRLNLFPIFFYPPLLPPSTLFYNIRVGAIRRTLLQGANLWAEYGWQFIFSCMSIVIYKIDKETRKNTVIFI